MLNDHDEGLISVYPPHLERDISKVEYKNHIILIKSHTFIRHSWSELELRKTTVEFC